jgi:hypothetical protein
VNNGTLTDWDFAFFSEQVMAQSLKTKGKIEIVSSDGKSGNLQILVVDLASEYVAKIL